MTPEAKVKAKVCAILDRYRVYYFKPIGGAYSKAGVPDIICCVNGRFLAIECKAGKGKLRPLQERELAAIREAQGTGIVVNETNIDDVEREVLACLA